MQSIFLLSFVLVAVCAAPPPPQDDKIHIPEKCNDVLAVKVCDQLKDMAKNLKLQSEEVKAAIIDAVKNGKVKSEDIYESAKDFLQQKVLTKKCEDFTTVDTCQKLRDLAGKLKIQGDKVEKFVIKAIAEGQVKAFDLYNRVVELYRKDIATKKCEDFLSKDQCNKIRDVAGALKIKTDQLEAAIVEAFVKAKVEGKDVLAETFNKLKNLAKNTSCEDLLNPNVCVALRKYANTTKIAFPKIMDTVLDSIVKGYKLGKGLLKAIYDVTDYFYDCEDVFTKSSCERLKKMVSVIGIKATEIDVIVRKYVRKGIDLGTSLYTKIYDYLKEKVFCKINIFCKSKDKRSIGDNISALLKRYKEMLDKSMPEAEKKIKDIIQKALSAAEKLGASAKKAIEEVIVKAKLKSENLRKFIQDLLNKKQTEVGVRITKRDIYDRLREALAKVHGKMKELITKFMAMSKEHLKMIHGVVSDMLKRILGDGKSKREIDEVDMINEVIEEVIGAEFEELEKEAEDEADKAIDEAILESYDQEDDKVLQKRDLEKAIDKVKEVYKNLGEKFKSVLGKIKSLNLDDIKEMLQKAGQTMMGSVKDMYNKIRQVLEKQE